MLQPILKQRSNFFIKSETSVKKPVQDRKNESEFLNNAKDICNLNADKSKRIYKDHDQLNNATKKKSILL